MTKNILIVLVAVMFIFPSQVTAQDTIKIKKKDEFSATLAYQSFVHYLGRSDSLNTNATVAILSYKLKNGLYVQGAGIFVQNSLIPFQYVGTAAEAGYYFRERDSIFSGNVYGSYFIYKDRSALVKSALKYQLGINTFFKTKIVTISPSVDFKFSDKIDVGLTLGVSHLFIKRLDTVRHWALAFNPTITAYASSLHFSEAYNKYPTLTVEEVDEVKRINLLAYELSFPVVLVLNKFNAFIIPSYVIPKKIDEHLGEYGPNKFYFLIGVGVKL